MVYVNLLEGTFGCSIGAVFLLKSNKWTKDVYFAPDCQPWIPKQSLQNMAGKSLCSCCCFLCLSENNLKTHVNEGRFASLSQ